MIIELDRPSFSGTRKPLEVLLPGSGRREPVSMIMTPFDVVEYPDVFKPIGPSFIPWRIHTAPNSFLLE